MTAVRPLRGWVGLRGHGLGLGWVGRHSDRLGWVRAFDSKIQITRVPLLPVFYSGLLEPRSHVINIFIKC